MYINLKIEPYEVKDTQQRLINLLPNLPFNILTVGKDSYIVGAVVETGLNLDTELQKNKGVYNLQIGRYSSLAEDILFMIDINHDYLSVSQGCISEFQNRGISKKIRRKGQILIENDVWIGHGATIMNGVTIHNGAIVAANATVTKDVPPYAIVAGNPARIVRYRFSEDVIEKLLKISWWNWSSQTIMERYNDFSGEIMEFVDKFYPEAVKDYEKVLEMPSPVSDMSGGKKYLLVPDFTDRYPLYPGIIKSFCESFNKKDAQLVVYLPQSLSADIVVAFYGILEQYSEYTVYVQMIDGNFCGIEQVVANVDAYITSRSTDNLYIAELAEKHNKQVVSGVDIPVFYE